MVRHGSERYWVALSLAALLAVVLLSLRGRSIWGAVQSRVRAVWDHPQVVEDRSGVDIVFLHHSVGENLIREGMVREALSAAGMRLWDHGYNSQGLIRPDGSHAGYGYGVPDDNTDPDGLARLFAQHVYRWPLNAFSGLMQHDVIVVKSCYPVSDIRSDAQLRQYESWYLGMRDAMDRHPDHLFIMVTPPPLHPKATTAEAAARARAFSVWLQSDAFLAGHANVRTVDLFGSFSEEEGISPTANMLRQEYWLGDDGDSHPNERANREIGPAFTARILEAVESYRIGTAGE